MLIVEYVYLYYYIFKNYGVFEYCKLLMDYLFFINKLWLIMSIKMFNLLLSKFKFIIEDFDKINLNFVILGFNIYNFNK